MNWDRLWYGEAGADERKAQEIANFEQQVQISSGIERAWYLHLNMSGHDVTALSPRDQALQYTVNDIGSLQQRLRHWVYPKRGNPRARELLNALKQRERELLYQLNPSHFGRFFGVMSPFSSRIG
jgi:hypothetical protein